MLYTCPRSYPLRRALSPCSEMNAKMDIMGGVAFALVARHWELCQTLPWCYKPLKLKLCTQIYKVLILTI